jgi:hypothetical protein
MFKKINIKWLAVSFVALLAIVVIVTLIDNKATTNRNRTFNSELTSIDTSKVTAISVYPKLKKDKIELIKTGKDWYVTIDNKKYVADENSILNILATLASMKATRVAAKDKSAWGEFEVTDSAASHVMINEGKKVTADLYIGKFSYKQPKDANPYMQQRGTLTSYVRLAGEEEVYAVEGILSMAFNRDANDFRNHTLIKSENEKWTRLTFTRPDGSYSLTKQNGRWMVDGLLADSAAVAGYFNSISWLSNGSYIDESLIQSPTASLELSIEVENLPQPIRIKAMNADTTNVYAISSSLNEGNYFSGKASGLLEKIFVEKTKFLTGKNN